MKDDHFDILELLKMFGNLGSELADFDFTEVHFLNFLDLILMLFESVFDLIQCAHSIFDKMIYPKSQFKD